MREDCASKEISRESSRLGIIKAEEVEVKKGSKDVLALKRQTSTLYEC